MPSAKVQGPRRLLAGRIVLVSLFGLLLVLGLRVPTAPPAEEPRGGGAVLESYDETAVRAFLRLAFGTEKGDDLRAVRKWVGEVPVGIEGDPTTADRRTVEETLRELDALTGRVRLRLDGPGARLHVHFVPRGAFPRIEPEAGTGEPAFFWCRWDGSGAMEDATVLIDSEGTSEAERSRLVRLMLARALGLPGGSVGQPESALLLGGDGETEDYTPLDRKVIHLLYEDAIRPGMMRGRVERILSWGGQE